jgi:hypothetical protein
MSLTPRQQFKFGFLLRCADEGLTLEQTHERVKEALAFHEKEAGIAEIISGALKGIGSAAGGVAEGVGKAAPVVADAAKSLGLLGLGGAAVGGIGAGHLAALAGEKEIDPEEIKKQELIATYRQQADRVRRNMAARSYRDDTPKPRAPQLFS